VLSSPGFLSNPIRSSFSAIMIAIFGRSHKPLVVITGKPAFSRFVERLAQWIF